MRVESSLLIFFLWVLLAVAFWVLQWVWGAGWLWTNPQADRPF